MVTRRPTHANHAKPTVAKKRLANRRAASSGGTLYTGGKSSSRGGHVNNVAGYGSGGSVGSPGSHRRSTASNSGSATCSTKGGDGMRIPTPKGGEILLTRRHFLYGALGAGALAAIGGGASVIIEQTKHDPNDDIAVLEVPESAVMASGSEEFKAAYTLAEDPATLMSLAGSFELPYGTLVWASDDSIAACLVPTDQGTPLTQIALLGLDSGSYPIVLEQAVGSDHGFEIYDVRATSSTLVWTEADILDGVWRVYTARHDGSAIGTPALVEEGDEDWEMPTIAAVGTYAFWQVLPKPDGEKKTESSLFKRAIAGASDVETLWTSNGRMATAPYATEDAVIITPRAATTTIHYQLTCLDANSGEVRDTMVLPTSMKPLEAGYGDLGFMFSFDAGYRYGGGIASLGTYTPASAVTDGDYSSAPWFRFSRNPTAAPAWCGPFFMVKATQQVVGINFDTNEYFQLDVKGGSDKYGDYLASTGTRNAVVTFANVDDKPLGGKAKKYCIVRVWTPA